VRRVAVSLIILATLLAALSTYAQAESLHVPEKCEAAGISEQREVLPGGKKVHVIWYYPSDKSIWPEADRIAKEPLRQFQQWLSEEIAHTFEIGETLMFRSLLEEADYPANLYGAIYGEIVTRYSLDEESLYLILLQRESGGTAGASGCGRLAIVGISTEYDGKDWQRWTGVVSHELIHLFGALHMDDSAYHAPLEYRGWAPLQMDGHVQGGTEIWRKNPARAGRCAISDGGFGDLPRAYLGDDNRRRMLGINQRTGLLLPTEDVVPPYIWLAEPLDDLYLYQIGEGATIELSFYVADNLFDNIDRVEVYLGDTLQGSVLGERPRFGPHTFSLNIPAQKSEYQVKLIALDKSGLTTEKTLLIQGATSPLRDNRPLVELPWPPEGALIGACTKQDEEGRCIGKWDYLLEADVFHDSRVARVEWWLNDIYLIGIATSEPFSAPLATWASFPSDGEHQLQARAYDIFGNVGFSEVITFTSRDTYNFMEPEKTDWEPPSVWFESPLDGATVSGTIELRVTAVDNVGVDAVEFFVDRYFVGNVLVGDDTWPVRQEGNQWSLPLDTTLLADGEYLIRAKAYDHRRFSNNHAWAEVNVVVQNPAHYHLTISSTAGGSVILPGEGAFQYEEGTVVSLAAEADEGYRFVRWTGDVGSIGDADAAETTIVMNGDHSITADFSAARECFIATATYGTPMADEVQVLRAFRDEHLMHNPIGRAFVAFYNKVSPPIAEFTTEHPTLKPVVWIGLLPPVAMGAMVVNTTAAEKMLMVGLLGLVALAIWARRSRGRAMKHA